MDRLDYWRLCTDYTVVQAALIVCGAVPDNLQYQVENNSSRRPEGYVAIRTAFYHALNSGKITPSKASYQCSDEGDPTSHFDIHSTTISVEEIDRFLKSARVQCDFFDRSPESTPAAHAEMPPKLSAALKAWSAVSSDPSRLRGRSPKQALEQWLVENAAELGLIRRDGRLNRTGVDEICKVANWKPSGGAPATPGGDAPISTPTTDSPPLMRLPLPPQPSFSGGAHRHASEDFTSNLDDEIPF